MTLMPLSDKASIKIDLVIPGKILLDRAGVQTLWSLIKNKLEAPPSVKIPSLCIITSSQSCNLALFIFITLANNEVDFISHLPHLVSSQIITLNFLVSNAQGVIYPKVSVF